MNKKMTKFGQTKLKKTVIGIDYSLTSPALCLNCDGDFMFHYLTNRKKYIGQMSRNILGHEHKEYKTPIQRFTQISDWVFDIISKVNISKVFIEGYSFGSKGQGIFQIAENCGILKYRLEEQNIPYTTLVPSVIKKNATGKGNADKEMMYSAFEKEMQLDLKKIFDTTKAGNPISDIVDSYFIQKVGTQ